MRKIAKAYAPQLEVPDHELERLMSRIQEDYSAAIADHNARMARFQRYYRLWRNLAETPAAGEEDTSNFSVPLLQWHVFQKWAKTMASIFGDDAEVRAEPVGPSDGPMAEKVSCYQTWRLLVSMDCVEQMTVFLFRAILFGRAHVYMPWELRTYQVPQADGSWTDEVDYEGPGFEPLWPDDLIVPAEDAKTIQNFSFVLHKFQQTPDELLGGEEAGIYRGIEEIYSDIHNAAEDKTLRDEESDTVKLEADEAEGVTREGGLSQGSTLRVWAWYGRWRKLKHKRSARTSNFKAREKYETDLLVYYLPDLHRIIGVQDLAEMYPNTPHRRPFREAALVHDGTYWPQGFGELLEEIEREMSATHNLGTEAGQYSVGPMIFYRPDSGFDPDDFEYRPFGSCAVDDPKGINVVQANADLTYPIMKDQALNTVAERITGQSDPSMGRQSDRPNAPRTATQYVGMIEEGNIRVALDTMALRLSLKPILRWIWELDQMFAPQNLFFRVTEESSGGVFDVRRGGAQLARGERHARYDFDLKFATTRYQKDAKKQDQLTLYQLDLGNPLIVQNPRALWLITSKLHKAFGDERFHAIIPEPPDLELSVPPGEEWARMLRGEFMGIRPDDSDDIHLSKHYQQIEDERAAGENADAAAIEMLTAHVLEHQTQRQQKRLQQALVEQLTSSLARNIGAGTGLQPGGMPLHLQQIQDVIGQMTGGAGPQTGGQTDATAPERT